MLKVTAYCRVSTDSEDQMNSLANQAKYFLEYIEANPDWEYIPLYVDEGLSGTSAQKRVHFMKMIDDARAGKFDLILTKEVSRFSRNTVDTLKFTRELKEIGVGVFFINDNIDTRVSNDEFRLTIMASVAQEESRKVSERVKWGQARSMEKGVVFGQKILGYRRGGKSLEIIPAEAETVKFIFQKYLIETKGLNAVARELMKAGFVTAYGNRNWDATAVLRILTNEKYCGDLKQKKFITPDFLTHKKKRNNGYEDFIFIKNNHAPIITREIFEQTQAEIIRRGKKKGTKYTARYAFSGKLLCGLCGSVFVNRNSSANGKVYKRWRCGKSMKCGADGCPAKMINEDKIIDMFLCRLDEIIFNKEEIINALYDVILKTLHLNENQTDYIKKEINKITAKTARLLDLRIDGEITKEEYFIKYTYFKSQISALEKAIEKYQTDCVPLTDKIKKRISDIVNLQIFSDEAAKEITEKIIIHDKNNCELFFKSDMIS